MEKALSGVLLLAVALLSGCKANAGPMQCPVVNISIPEGSSEMIMPDISNYSRPLILCHKNHSSSSWESIASIRNGALRPYRSDYKAYFSISEHSLVVMNASTFLIGEYQLSNWLTETCLQHIFLDVVSPTQCPVVNISILEGSSEMIMPNISSYPNSVLLHRKSHSSSWEYIVNIQNGSLILCLGSYTAHFSVSESGLVVMNASRFLIGEYQFNNGHSKTCLQRFFLDVVGSKHKHYYAIAAGPIVLVVVLLVIFALWWKQRRGRPAHPSTEVPDSGNESLHPMATETEETEINIPSRESGIAANGMLWQLGIISLLPQKRE